MISAIFTALGSAVTNFSTVMIGLFESLIAIFYASPDGVAPKVITNVGSLAIVGFGVALVFFGFRFVFRLIHLRG